MLSTGKMTNSIVQDSQFKRRVFIDDFWATILVSAKTKGYSMLPETFVSRAPILLFRAPIPEKNKSRQNAA